MSIPQTMKEYRLPVVGSDSYRKLALVESPVPKVGPEDVLVKNYAVSIQFRDLLVSSHSFDPSLPTEPNLVPGSDMAGEVVAVGEKVTDWKVGDRVCPNFFPDLTHGNRATPKTVGGGLGAAVDGTMTQYKTFRSHSLIRIPDHLTYEEAACLPCAGITAYNALFGGPVLKSGDKVLIEGTGGVSIFGLQFAVASGATVIVTSSSDEKLALAKKLGATHTINYKKTPNWEEEVLRVTNGDGVDFTVEVGGAETFDKAMACSNWGATISLVGWVSGMSASNTTGGAISKALTIRGVQVGSVELFERMTRLISANPKTTRPVVDKVFPLTELAAAYAHLESQKHAGKVVVKFTE